MYNRRELRLRLAEEHRPRLLLRQAPMRFTLLDIDLFKQVNDTCGHPAGDAVLKTLADILRKQLRDVDVAARYGGEEFVVVFPEISGGTAKPVAERVRRAVAASRSGCRTAARSGLRSASAYRAIRTAPPLLREVVDRADQALYVAKEAGRNRVVLYRDLLKAQIEKDPTRIVELLNEGLENIQPIVTAVDTKTAFFRNHSQCTCDLRRARLGRALRSQANGTGDASSGRRCARRSASLRFQRSF